MPASLCHTIPSTAPEKSWNWCHLYDYKQQNAQTSMFTYRRIQIEISLLPYTLSKSAFADIYLGEIGPVEELNGAFVKPRLARHRSQQTINSRIL